MSKKPILVVGDIFHQFASGKDVITFSQLNKLIEANLMICSSKTSIVLIPGQGLGKQDIETLLFKLKLFGSKQSIDTSLWLSLPKRTTTSKSHKQRSENIIISSPYKISKNMFEMHLLIDERSELMQDHQTGQHLQAMLIIEAARQSQIAIVETFYQPTDYHYSFLLNDLSITFNQFTFPLPAKLNSTTLNFNTIKPSRQDITSSVSITQNGMQTASLQMTSSIIESSKIKSLENRMAKQASKNYLKTLNKLLQNESAILA